MHSVRPRAIVRGRLSVIQFETASGLTRMAPLPLPSILSKTPIDYRSYSELASSYAEQKAQAVAGTGQVRARGSGAPLAGRRGGRH